MTKTYSEQRQLILFKASRDLRKVAAQVLDDVQNEVELRNASTLAWATTLAQRIAEQANELENTAHELCVASSLSETLLYKSRRAYEASIDAFEARITYFAPWLDDDGMSDEERKLGLDSFAPEDRDYGRVQFGI